jgi:predicted SprT family Zn-dependent metalloprotease
MITTQQFKSLDDIYNFYNEKLFNNELPQCIINLSRKGNSYGFFAPRRWKNEKQGNIVHEISINPDHMNRADIEWHSTLVHEMCHLWQFEFGKSEFRAYHDKEFANKMEEIGLITSNTGQEGGKRTGQRMTHYIKPDANFENTFLDLILDDSYKKREFYKPNLYFIVTKKKGSDKDTDKDKEEDTDNPKTKVKTKNKIKYSCSCNFNIWGKPDLSVKCNSCDEDFKPQE